MNLGSHLGDAPIFSGQFLDASAFGHGPGQGLLAINVPSASNCRGGCHGVSMIRGGHHHRFHILLVEQSSKIGIGPGGWMLLRGSRQSPLVHIAQGHNILARDIVQVVDPLVGDTDDCHVQLVIG